MHILMVPGFFEGLRENNPVNGIFFLEQAQIMREYGGCRINMYYPTATKKKAEAHGLHKAERGGVEIWRECRFRTLRSRKAAVARAADDFRNQYEREHGKPGIIWQQSAHSASIFATMRLAKMWRIPYFVVEHSARFFEPFTSSHQRRVRRVFGNAAFVAAASGFLAGYMREVYRDVVVLHNPVAPVFFFQTAAKTNDDTFIFHSTGRLENGKGHETVIAAFARMPAECRLIIAGSGSMLPSLQQQTRDLGVEERVKFAGFLGRNALASSLRAADAYVTATAYETFNLSLAEAMVCGLPCAATPTGIAKDIVDEDTGALTDNFDEDSVFRAMLTVHGRRYDKDQIASKTRARFSPKQFTETLTTMMSAAAPSGANI